LVGGNVHPCRVASRKENLPDGTQSIVMLENTNRAAVPGKSPQHIQEHERPQVYRGVEEKGQTHDEKEEYFLHFNSQPKYSLRQVVPVSGRTLELALEFNFNVTFGGRTPAQHNDDRCHALSAAPSSKH